MVKVHKSEMLSIQTRDLIKRTIEIHFVDNEEYSLTQVMNSIGVSGLDKALIRSFEFLEERFDFEELSISSLESVDFKELVYEFKKYTKLKIPAFSSENERQMYFQIVNKIARIIIHEILVPALQRIDQQSRDSIINVFTDTVHRVCIVEGLEYEPISQELRLDRIMGQQKIGFVIPEKPSKMQETRIVKVYYLIFNGGDYRLKKLVNLLHDLYFIILSPKSLTTDFFNSNGKFISPIEVDVNRLNSFLYLICLLKKNPIQGKKYIEISEGKAIWDYLQQNLIDNEKKHIFKQDLRELSSRIKQNPSKYKLDIKIAQEIFNEIKY